MGGGAPQPQHRLLRDIFGLGAVAQNPGGMAQRARQKPPRQYLRRPPVALGEETHQRPVRQRGICGRFAGHGSG
jgi:hypothetical protein